MVEDDVSESLLNIVLDAIDDIIMILDTDHTIVWITGCFHTVQNFLIQLTVFRYTQYLKCIGRTLIC